MKKHHKDYVDPHRTTEQERDSIEHEVSHAIEGFHFTCFSNCSPEQLPDLCSSAG